VTFNKTCELPRQRAHTYATLENPIPKTLLIIFLGITYFNNASLIHVHVMQINMTMLKNTISNAQCTIFLTFVGVSLFLFSLSSSSLSEVIGGGVIGNGCKNYLFGTMVGDTIGKKGNDRLYGLAGADKIFGDSGDDILQGHQGNDILNGEDGNDLIVGGGDTDNIVGGNGDDILIASYAVNNTSIRDYAQDSISCGSGNDIAYFNIADNDSASNDCENLISTSGPASNSTVILPEDLSQEENAVNESNIF
jgi:hypothetical protein